jgi:2-oxoisovalerate dehydrogenase E1 component beta subunit
VTKSVCKTGRVIVSHEAPITSGFGAELAAVIQQECFLSLEAPVSRVCGADTPFPLAHEKFYIPSHLKVLDAINDIVDY